MADGHETEPPLHGKQLVFVFMAATVAAVVVFLSGVMVGRGVRLQRGGLAFSDAASDPTLEAAPPLAAPTGTTAQGPSPASREGLSYPSHLSELNPPDVLPERAEDPTADVLGRVPAPEAEKGTGARVRELTRANEPAKGAAVKAPAAKAPTEKAAVEKVPTTARPEAGPPAAPVAADADAGKGFAVQVAAVRDRAEAEKIAARLKAKGYATYITSPAPGMFRERVGKFPEQREAAAAAAKLEKEEQFKPWITQ
ncbi:MAG: SPOR domain-containing protein [Vicinamibacterales bacterium]|nr:SPOR domain-containing protein [Vicinamibacterales bacterium]